MCLPVARGILTGLLLAWPLYLVLCDPMSRYGNNKYENWPKFDCHPSTDAKASNDDEYMYAAGTTYMDCLHGGYSSRGYSACPKACQLVVKEVIPMKEPSQINVDGFIDLMAEELGYDTDKPEAAQKQLMDKVRLGLNDCKNKHKEYEAVKSLENATCQPWDNFLKCLEKTVGC